MISRKQEVTCRLVRSRNGGVWLMLRHQNLPLAHLVRRRDHRMFLHLFDQFRRLVIADAQFAL